MTLRGPATGLTVVVGESDQARQHLVIIPSTPRSSTKAHRAGLAGASVMRGIEGFGRSNHVRTTRLLSLSEDLPVVVVMIDPDERIRASLPELEELHIEGLAIVEPVEVIRYAGRGPSAPWQDAR